jgi:regulator of RNase E activity RraA
MLICACTPSAKLLLLPRWQSSSRVRLCSTPKVTSIIDQVRTDDRIPVIAGEIHGISCWGDILANAAQTKHIRGTIIDGMSRDIDGSRDIGFPVFGRGVTMISARNRLVQYNSGSPLEVQGVTVHQDDYVITDRCGTVFIPASSIKDVADLGERIDRRHTGMIEAVRGQGSAFSAISHGIDMTRYMAEANETIIVCVQIESRSGVENVEAICAVPGIGKCYNPTI